MNSDNWLVKAINESDIKAFDEVFKKYYPGLLGYAKAMLKYPSDEAEDIVSEVFCTIWRNRSQLSITSSLASYLYIAVKNRIYDHYRKAKLSITNLDEMMDNFVVDPGLPPDKALFYKEMNQRIQYLISRLPGQMRMVFQMNRNDGLTYEEIAGILDISVNSVKTHMFSALKFLKAACQVDIY